MSAIKEIIETKKYENKFIKEKFRTFSYFTKALSLFFDLYLFEVASLIFSLKKSFGFVSAKFSVIISGFLLFLKNQICPQDPHFKFLPSLGIKLASILNFFSLYMDM